MLSADFASTVNVSFEPSGIALSSCKSKSRFVAVDDLTLMVPIYFLDSPSLPALLQSLFSWSSAFPPHCPPNLSSGSTQIQPAASVVTNSLRQATRFTFGDTLYRIFLRFPATLCANGDLINILMISRLVFSLRRFGNPLQNGHKKSAGAAPSGEA